MCGMKIFLRRQIYLVPGDDLIWGLHLGEYCLRKPDATGEEIINAAKIPMPMSSLPAPQRLPNPGRGTGFPAFGGTKATDCHRSGAPAEPADPDPGRSHLGFGYRSGTAGAGGLGTVNERKNHLYHCPSPLHRPGGGQNCRPFPRKNCGGWYPWGVITGPWVICENAWRGCDLPQCRRGGG